MFINLAVNYKAQMKQEDRCTAPLLYTPLYIP